MSDYFECLKLLTPLGVEAKKELSDELGELITQNKVSLEMDRATLFFVASYLQVALCRSNMNSPESRVMWVTARQLQKCLSGAPLLNNIIRRGWDHIREAQGFDICTECGCTEKNACTGGCHWVMASLCNKCAEALNNSKSEGEY